ncbi:MAG: thiamine-phosphate kinase [Mycobacteriales bacterium]
MHFRTDWSSAYDVGRKAAAANLADIAAMGAVPTAMVVGLALPAETEVAWCEELTRGLLTEGESAGLDVGVVGGDVVRSDRLTVSVTVLGDLQGRAAVTRSGARPGDVLCLLGPVGGSAAGLAVFERGDPSLVRRHADVVDAHRRPAPPYRSAVAAAVAGATAMVDVSDGLVADLGHLAEASGVRCVVVAADVPLHPGLPAAAADLGLDPLTLALTGGEDHAFVVVLPEPVYAEGTYARIGSVVAGSGLEWHGWTPPAGAGGHAHFAPGRGQ